MAISTLLFGETVEEGDLENLFDLMGKEMPEYRGQEGSSVSVSGKARFLPTKGSLLELDLYVTVTRFHTDYTGMGDDKSTTTIHHHQGYVKTFR